MSAALADIYGRRHFLALVGDLLPDVIFDTRDVSNVASSFAEVVSLGSSPSLNLQIFEVKVSGSLEKRVAIASDAFKLMKRTASYRSLVAFYSEETDQWRLSLLTAKPTIDEGKVVTRFSSPKRYSYLLGPGSKLGTPAKQLIVKGRVTNFEDLSKRFALEVVNDEFYREIAKLYDELVGSDQVSGVLKYPSEMTSKHEFGVRLIGRIIFCWFLREKRSNAGTSLIPSEVLSRLAANETDYYHAVLAPLFFEVLNKRLRNREARFQGTDFATIPYLNGGLFNPDLDDCYKFDKVLQKSAVGKIEVPDGWLHKFFDLLEMYNFTVDENTSFDIDLSIDPEMLGRIFENLLARINPETGQTVRKGTGSFYTPREIVEYMVDQSLSNYLIQITELSEERISALLNYDLNGDEPLTLTTFEKQDVLKALSEAKILDPACGSGAFPMGILQKIVFILQRVDPDAMQWLQKQLVGASPELRRHLEEEFSNKNFDYLRKLGVIRESIYGVDIQPIATEISRLRCFLTLVVDQSVEDDAPNRGIEPLPNLDFKFVTANSLIKLPAAHSGQADLFDDQEGIAELKDIRSQYFTAGESERDQIKYRFAQVQKSMFQRMIVGNGFAKLTQKLSAWDPFSHKTTDWFDAEWMFGVTKFNIVIANPPYISASKIGELNEVYREQSRVAHGSYDLFIIFFEMGLDVLDEHGVLTYISSNKFFIADYSSKLRALVWHNTEIIQLINLADCKRVFESAAVSTAITILKNSKPTSENYMVKVKNLTDKDFDLIPVINLESVQSNKLVTGANFVFNIDLTDQGIGGVVYKMEQESVPMGSLAEVRTGVMGFEYWGMDPYVTEENDDDGVELITNGLVEPYRFLTNRTINLYKKKYTNPRLKLDRAPLSDQTKKLFRSKKIIVKGVSGKLIAAYDTKGRAILVAVHAIVPKSADDVNYFLALLNSKLFNWYHVKKFYAARIPEGSLKYPISFIKNIPIRPFDGPLKRKISDIAGQIVALDLNNDEANTMALKQQIDQLVYELYGLTADDIKIVESI